MRDERTSAEDERWRARVASLAAFGDSAPLDEVALARAASELLEDFTRTTSLIYRPTMTADHYELAVWHHVRVASSLRGDFARVLATPGSMPFLYDPLRPQPHDRNRVRRFGVTDKVSGSAMERVFERNGLGRALQIRTLVCSGPILLSWVGIFRERSSARVASRDAWAVGHLSRALRRPLRLLRRLPPPSRGGLFEAAVAALPGDAYLVGERGRIELANDRGARMLASELVATSSRVAQALEAHRHGRVDERYEVHPVRGAPGALCLVHARVAAGSDLSARIARARAHWKLSPQQTVVLRHLAHGQASKEIAATLGVSPRTVEAHVAALLRLAGVDSRLRLVSRLFCDN